MDDLSKKNFLSVQAAINEMERRLVKVENENNRLKEVLTQQANEIQALQVRIGLHHAMVSGHGPTAR